ncbi:MAG: MASE1 domain-containing protein, partial [Verrucomicrobia bacterium]|nr:MASE1 domain-containing protein [Verrucomicrobiota bacterium]
DNSVAPLGLLAGLSTAFVILWGYRMWPALFLSAFCLEWLIHTLPWNSALGIAIGNTLQPTLALFLLRRVSFNPRLQRVPDVIFYGLFAAGISTLVAAFIGTSTLWWFHLIPSDQWLSAAQIWHLSRHAGVLVLGSVILVWSGGPSVYRKAWEWIALVISAELIFTALFWNPFGWLTFIYRNPILAPFHFNIYIASPIFIWAALRFQKYGMSVIILCMECTGILAISHGHAYSTSNLVEDLASFQVFIGLTSWMLLVLAAAIAEREQAIGAFKSVGALALQAALSRTRFLAHLSHEIRTPLVGILGTLEMLQRTPLSAEQKNLTALLGQSVDPLAKVVDDVLDISAIEARKVVLARSSFSIADFVDQAAASFQSVAKNKHLSFKVVIDPEVPPKAIGDRRRLTQILMNFLSNAFKYTEKGEVVLHLSVSSQTASSFTLKLEVSDTGIGISEDSLSNLFVPFAQVNPTLGHGSGLGLSIAKNLIDLMQGELGVSSQLGVGSTFWASIPLARWSEAIQEPPLPKEEVLVYPAKRILVAEDDAISGRVILLQLEHIGYQADLATDGDEVL